MREGKRHRERSRGDAKLILRCDLLLHIFILQLSAKKYFFYKSQFGVTKTFTNKGRATYKNGDMRNKIQYR